ncbi:MAG: response regulator [Pirellulaceae bacterium]
MTRVLDVGNCGPDHAAIKSLLVSSFGATVDQAHGADDAVACLESNSYQLVLVNRKLDRDYSDGIEVIRRIKSDPRFATIACMLVTNYAEHQEMAVAVGAERGFGKLELHTDETLQLLRPYFQASSAS